MIRKTKTTSLLLATGLATLAMQLPAFALDADAFIDRIESVYKVMGYDLDFGPATLDGNTITVDGVVVGFTGGDEIDPMDVDTVLTFEGVIEHDDGSYSAESLRVPDVNSVFGDEVRGELSLTGIVAEGLWLPPEGQTDAVSLMQTVERVATGPLLVKRDGAEVIKYDGLDYVSSFGFNGDDLETIDTDFSISNIWADLSTVGEEEPEAGAIIEALGLTIIDGNINQIATWNLVTGDFVMDEFSLDFANIGALNIAMDLRGFTAAVLEKIYAMQSEDIDFTTEEGQAKQMMLGMEMAQAISIGGASVRYDDAGLVGRALDFFAGQSGVARAQFVEVIKPAIPEMINQAGIPELTAMVTPAAESFLDDPQSLEVSVKPASPTSFLVLAAAAANPAGLIKALNLAVTANQ
ncbi:MAG: hypothetical protein GX970_01120 [Phyllobacteriaceae bacterium]|nr:hypothetical protein [Phyllobacteriaceae bacterium]